MKLLTTHVEVFDSLDALGLEETWTRLHAGAPAASLFTSFDWCHCWLQTVGQHARPFVLVVRDENGKAIGLAPLCVENENGARWLRFMGRERVSGDHLDFIARREDHGACVRAVLDQLDERPGEYDGLILGELHPTSPTLNAFMEWAEQRDHLWYEREHRQVPFVDLPDSFDEFLGGLSANMRYHIRRRRRGLLRERSARLEMVEDGPRVTERLGAFLELHRRRWEQEGLSGHFGDAEMREFLRRFCKRAADAGLLRLHVLLLEGTPQAVLIAFHEKQTASYYQIGWNPNCPVASPGVLLMAHSIEQAILEGLARYDFLRGDERYKLRWTQWAAEQTTLVIGCGLSARAVLAADQIKNHLKAAVTTCLGADNWERAKRLVRGAD